MMLIMDTAIQFDYHLPTMFCFVMVLAAVVAALPPTTAEVIQKKFDPRVFNTTLSGRAERGISVCSKGGAACDATCRKTGICISEKGTYVFRETLNCGELFCDASGASATCEKTTTCVAVSEEIGCDMTGVFPDPYNCHNVINCVEGRVASSVPICEENMAYDSCTGFCDVVLPNSQCKPQTSLCTRIGDIDTLAHNDRLYYYCVQGEDGLLHPVLGRCSQGYFDLDNFRCTESEDPGCINPDL